MDPYITKPALESAFPCENLTASGTTRVTDTITASRESVECHAFQKCFSVIADGIIDPGRLAIQLYSREMIGSDLRTEAQKQGIEERVKIERLLSAVEKQIVVSPATKFREFLEVLRNEPSLEHLATRLEETHCELSQQCTPTPRAKRPVDNYASYLKSTYIREKQLTYDKWPQVKSKKYINLALIEKEDITKQEADQFTKATIHGNIDDIKKSKRATDIAQIALLPDGSQPKCILVEGAPGVGKSTFARKLCRKWGKGKLLQQYKLIVLLRLRDNSVQNCKEISDLFKYHKHDIQQAAVQEIQYTGAKGVLLLFEGYDELPENLRSRKSIFLDIITGRELPEATVLITSRPWASEFLRRQYRRQISQHIEILGFTKANIRSYLESTTANDPLLLAGLKQYISCYPHINSLMFIPLNSAIVVQVYRNSKKDQILVPKTMTELYSSLVRSLLLRYLFDHSEHGKKRWKVHNFSDLPQDVYQQLCKLGRIAYEGIFLHRQEVVFSDLPEGFETLGLMHCTPELYVDEGVTVSYNFLHLTVQEYLAALHLSQQPAEKQLSHYQRYSKGRDKNEHKHFHMVLRFLSGVRKFSGYSKELLNTLGIGVQNSGDDLSSAICEVTIDLLHWLFEAQDNDVIATLLGSSNIQLCEPDEMTPFDCFVIGYCVSHSNCTWRIKLSNIEDEGVEMIARGAVEEKTNCKGGFSEIDLNENDITSKGIKHLLTFPKQLIKRLETMNLHINNLDSKSCEAVANLIPHMTHLKRLNLSYNPNIGKGGAVSLITSLTANNTLISLWLSGTGIGVQDCQALRKLLYSTSLRGLNISENFLPPKAVELIIDGFQHTSTLKTLNMTNSCFSPQNSISLASVLRTNHTLIILHLGGCDIDSDGACQLASAVCSNDTLRELYLMNNPIGVEGATAFAEMLLQNRSVTTLNLQDDSIGEEGVQKLIDSLTYNTTMELLELPTIYNSLIASGVCMRVCFSD